MIKPKYFMRTRWNWLTLAILICNVLIWGGIISVTRKVLTNV